MTKISGSYRVLIGTWLTVIAISFTSIAQGFVLPEKVPTTDELVAIENELSWRWAIIQQSPQDAHTFLEILENPETSPEIRKFIIEEFDRRHIPFFEEMDKYIAYKFDHVINSALKRADEIHKYLETTGQRMPKRVLKARAKLVAAKELYDSNRHQIGKGKDRLRTSAFRGFFDAYERYLNSLHWWTHLKHWVDKKILGKLAWAKYLLIVHELPLFLRDVYQPLEKQVIDGTVPVINRLFGRGFKAIGRVDGLKISVRGKENIVGRPPQGVVNIYVPNHATRIPDQAALAETGIRDFNIMTNFGIPGLVKRATGMHGVTMVGLPVKRNEKGEKIVPEWHVDPTEKVLRLAREGIIHTFIIYPQGASSGGLFEVMGPRESFVPDIILGLQSLGIGVRLIPISFPKNAYLLNHVDPSKPLEAIIHKPISPEVVRQLTSQRDPQLLARVIRSIWQQDQATEDNLFREQPRITELKNRLQNWLTRRGTTECQVFLEP